MQRLTLCVLAASTLLTSPVSAEPLSLQPPVRAERRVPAYDQAAIRVAAAPRSSLGGGFIEAIFGGGDEGRSYPRYQQDQPGPRYLPPDPAQTSRYSVDPRFQRQVVDYQGGEPPGTVIVDTRQFLLYLVQDNGKAIRYGVGVGRPGFTWAGMKEVTAKREWPDWTPPPEMLQRRPDLPRHMAGGPDNPLGARALYLGSSLYRIHGSNEPWTIGTQVSSGCIRMRNEDVMDLYERVKIGTKVVVI